MKNPKYRVTFSFFCFFWLAFITNIRNLRLPRNYGLIFSMNLSRQRPQFSLLCKLETVRNAPRVENGWVTRVKSRFQVDFIYFYFCIPNCSSAICVSSLTKKKNSCKIFVTTRNMTLSIRHLLASRHMALEPRFYKNLKQHLKVGNFGF